MRLGIVLGLLIFGFSAQATAETANTTATEAKAVQEFKNPLFALELIPDPDIYQHIKLTPTSQTYDGREPIKCELLENTDTTLLYHCLPSKDRNESFDRYTIDASEWNRYSKLCYITGRLLEPDADGKLQETNYSDTYVVKANSCIPYEPYTPYVKVGFKNPIFDQIIQENGSPKSGYDIDHHFVKKGTHMMEIDCTLLQDTGTRVLLKCPTTFITGEKTYTYRLFVSLGKDKTGKCLIRTHGRVDHGTIKIEPNYFTYHVDAKECGEPDPHPFDPVVIPKQE